VREQLPQRLYLSRRRACHPIELCLQRLGGPHELWQLLLCSVSGVKMGCFEELEAATPPETRP
jgi:hypothetical protein